MNKKKKKFEFSKIIIFIAGIVELAIILFSCFMVWRTGDTSILGYLIPSVSIVSSTGVAFYFNKAKLENKIKLMNSLGIDMTENAFNIY